MDSRHPENPACTRAYKQVQAGDRCKAIATLTAIGYVDAEYQVEMIEGFIQFQETFNANHQTSVRRARRLVKD